jgi:hypothetical protein
MIGLQKQGFNTTCITKLFPRGHTGAGIIIFAVMVTCHPTILLKLILLQKVSELLFEDKHVAVNEIL